MLRVGLAARPQTAYDRIVARSRASLNRRLGVAAAVTLSAVAPAAEANGKFPFADQVVVDQSNPDHLVVRTSFGLVVSSDAGASWGWVCEDAMGYADYEPGLAVVGSGAIVLGVQIFCLGVVCDQISAIRLEQMEKRQADDHESLREQESRRAA